MGMGIFFAELLGTFLLVLLGVGANAGVLLSQTKSHSGGWVAVSLGWGFAVTLGVYIASWISGGHVNPAITISFASLGIISWSLVPFYLFGQFIGGLLGACAAWAAYYLQWEKTANKEMKLMCFATRPVVRHLGWNFVTEFIATAVLVLGVLGILNINNGVGSGMGPYLIGILVAAIGLSLGGPTGFAINPARDLCPRLVHHFLPMPHKGSSEWDYAWVPILGPICGAVVGGWIYALLIARLASM